MNTKEKLQRRLSPFIVVASNLCIRLCGTRFDPSSTSTFVLSLSSWLQSLSMNSSSFYSPSSSSSYSLRSAALLLRLITTNATIHTSTNTLSIVRLPSPTHIRISIHSRRIIRCTHLSQSIPHRVTILASSSSNSGNAQVIVQTRGARNCKLAM